MKSANNSGKPGSTRRAAAGRTKRAAAKASMKEAEKAGDSFRDMVLEALEQAGGADYLEQLAREKPTAFLALVGKVLPLQVKAEHEVGKRLAKALAWKPPT